MSSDRSTRKLFVAMAALLILATYAFSAVLGRIEGTVRDEGRGTVPGAAVTLTGPTGATRTAVSDAQGAFAFPGLPAGRYSLRVELAGFATSQQTVMVAAGTTHVEATLRVAGLMETVEVMASAPGISTSSAETRDREQLRAFDTEAYAHIAENPFRAVRDHPLSTFSIDVDTASYANVRRFLEDGELPPVDAVRIEELINYFPYDYEAPKGEEPLAVHTELSACPWDPAHRLALVALQARTVEPADIPARNLVFLVDVSGSMDEDTKLPLVQQTLRMLVEQLTARDRLGIVVYAGSSGVVLESTPGDAHGAILEAIGRLRAGGSTNGAEGLELAYRVARQGFIQRGLNRVVLATDGDFNVGVTSEGELVRLIEAKRKSGVFLSVLGFGMGNLKDSTMEKLADKGDGNYAYIDSPREARKVTGSAGTLLTVARDVKIQVELNPAAVSAYRLLGYENRLLEDEDFNDDAKDAGELGAGQTVTALYEIVPAGAPFRAKPVDPLLYQQPATMAAAALGGDLMTVKVRYKPAAGGRSRRIATTLRATASGEPSANLRFASAVAGFGLLLRDSKHKGTLRFDDVRDWTRASAADDPAGLRAEFLSLVDRAEALSLQRLAAAGAPEPR